MDIDWIAAIALFLIFVSWSLSYYIDIFQAQESEISPADSDARRIIELLSAKTYNVPVEYTADSPVSGAVFEAKSLWYHGEKNSTRVFYRGVQIPCIIEGESLYWQADISAGENYFEIKTADANSTLNCSGAFTISAPILAVPWAFEEGVMLSMPKILEMSSMNYEDFASQAKVAHDFKISIKTQSENITYGKSMPAGPKNIYSKAYSLRVFETSENANVTILLW